MDWRSLRTCVYAALRIESDLQMAVGLVLCSKTAWDKILAVISSHSWTDLPDWMCHTVCPSGKQWRLRKGDPLSWKIGNLLPVEPVGNREMLPVGTFLLSSHLNPSRTIVSFSSSHWLVRSYSNQPKSKQKGGFASVLETQRVILHSNNKPNLLANQQCTDPMTKPKQRRFSP